MNEEERKCLNDCGFANVTQLLLAYVSLQQENARLKDKNKKASELLQILHYNFPDYDDMHKKIEDIEEILKEN